MNNTGGNGSMSGGLGPLNGINNLNKLVNLQNQMSYNNQPEDWEQVLKLAMMRNSANKQLEERNNLLNMMGNGLGGGKPHSLLGKPAQFLKTKKQFLIWTFLRRLQQQSEFQWCYGPKLTVSNATRTPTA